MTAAKLVDGVYKGNAGYMLNNAEGNIDMPPASSGIRIGAKCAFSQPTAADRRAIY
ncbi:MAG: hypothetical protein RIN56_20465 [Sporomusaceae bacterium]|nr:hypothetical protein [Sporomusaceae bacterium]